MGRQVAELAPRSRKEGVEVAAATGGNVKRLRPIAAALLKEYRL